MYPKISTWVSGPASLLAALFTAWTCCIIRSQYKLSSDFLWLKELVSSNTAAENINLNVIVEKI